jgi:iron(III) transport system ATP-binding protein
MTLSDRIVVMNDGKIEQIGSPTEIYRQPQTRFVADFIGRANFAEGTVLERRDSQLTLDVLGTRLIVPAPGNDFQADQGAVLVIRPEMVEIGPTEEQAQGTVRRATYLGNVVEYDVEVAGQLLALVEYDPRHTTVHSEGQTVGLRFLEDCLYVLPQQG